MHLNRNEVYAYNKTYQLTMKLPQNDHKLNPDEKRNILFKYVQLYEEEKKKEGFDEKKIIFQPPTIDDVPQIIKADEIENNEIIEYEIPDYINQQSFNELCKLHPKFKEYYDEYLQKKPNKTRMTTTEEKIVLLRCIKSKMDELKMEKIEYKHKNSFYPTKKVQK